MLARFRRTEQSEPLREIAGMSYRDLERAIHTALIDLMPAASDVWIRDLFDDRVIYQVSSSDGAEPERLYQRTYTVANDGITFGEPEAVTAVTVYVPVDDAALTEVIRREGGRWALYSHDGARKLGTFDSREEAIRREAQLRVFAHRRRVSEGEREPAAASESAADGRVELTSDLVPLVEAAGNDGIITVKLIGPGKGSSGYYSPDVLKRDGPRVFTRGLHMYLDHPSRTEQIERPERSVRDLAGVLESDAEWRDDGPAGPGLYAQARVFEWARPLIRELAPHIGVSIRALGRVTSAAGERIVEAIELARAADFVTEPGAGGAVLTESARGQQRGADAMGHDDQTQQQQRQQQQDGGDELTETRRLLQEQQSEIARLREALLIRDAREVIREALADIALHPIARERIFVDLVNRAFPRHDDGTLNVDALREAVRERAKAEADYLARVAGSGRVTGMGTSAPPERKPEELTSVIESGFARILGDDRLAKVAANGRAGGRG